MSNVEIIIGEGIQTGLYTQAEMEAFAEQNGYLQINTFQGWKKLGYTVKKGEKAIIKTRLWRMTKYKNIAENQMDGTETVIDLTKPGAHEQEQKKNEQKVNHYYLTEAALFDISQVEKVA